MTEIRNLLEKVVAGKPAALRHLIYFDHAQVLKESKCLPALTIYRGALVLVLEEWLGGRVANGDVQQWASFIRRGYVSGADLGPVEPLNIQYDVSYEDEIAEVISRLDEVGDQIDGVVEDHEKIELLRKLSS